MRNVLPHNRAARSRRARVLNGDALLVFSCEILERLLLSNGATL